MVQKAYFQVIVGGEDISARLSPFLVSLRITDQEGTHSDAAEIVLDDTDGQLLLPQDGQPIKALLGWDGQGASTVFEGTIDEVRSSGNRGTGRLMRVSAKGVDTKSKAKEPQQKNMDDMTVGQALNEAGKSAGITVKVDPKFEQKKRSWFGMNDESFLHFGNRIAGEVGGIFKIKGDKAVLADKAGQSASGLAMPTVNARWGDNLISWDISPRLGRPQFNQIGSRWYDMAAAKWVMEIVSVDGTDALAQLNDRFSRADKDEAKGSAENLSKDSKREKGGGSATLNGTAQAKPGGTCNISGARAGVDGAWRIESVTHIFTRDGGWTTNLSLKMPGEGVGSDNRA